MKVPSLQTLIFLTLLIQIAISADYKFYSLSQQHGGACLDGSPPGLYIHQGSGENKNNFMIYFDSGGFCGAGDLASTLESCYQRSFGSLGTTANCKPYKNFDNQGLLSTIPQKNPLFHDWTKVFGIYCDGTEYLGSRTQPIPYKDRLLYFRGANNTLQQLRFLNQTYALYSMNKIVITGVSAGGIATYLWSNHVVQHATAKVYAIPDSGLFLTDYISPIYGINILKERAKTMLDIAMGDSKYPIEQCLNEWNGDYLSCLNAANLAKYLKAPMLIVESPYDQWSIENILGVDCLYNKNPPYSLQNCSAQALKAIDDYKQASRLALKKMLKEKPITGLWAPACVQHGFTDTFSFNDTRYRIPSQTGPMIFEVIKTFLDNQENPPIFMDTVDWPLNKGCNGISSIKKSSQHNLSTK